MGLLDFIIIVLIFAIMSIFIFRAFDIMSRDYSEVQTGVEVTVVDLETDKDFIYSGKVLVPITKYRATIAFEDGTEHKVSCSSSEYSSLKIGDKVLCSLYLNENNEILRIKLE